MQQTYPTLEIIVIDDGSTDGTTDILRQLATEDPRIRLIIHPQNKKLIVTLNEGLSVARGKYIARMDADDIALPQRIALQVDVLERHPEVVVVGSFLRAITGWRKFRKWVAPINDTKIRSYLFVAAPFFHPTTMFRNGLPDLYYSEDAYRAEDYELWTRLLKQGKGYNIPKVLLYYRLLPNSETRLGERDVTQRFKIFTKIHANILSGYGIYLSGHTQEIYTASTVKTWTTPFVHRPLSELLSVFATIDQKVGKSNMPVAHALKGYLGLRLLAWITCKGHRMRFSDMLEVLKSSYFYRGLLTLMLRRVKL